VLCPLGIIRVSKIEQELSQYKIIENLAHKKLVYVGSNVLLHLSCM
ncbi:Hypothetical protein GSB_153493, partial [Giardia duodenalis]